jgi:hypothetical protein
LFSARCERIELIFSGNEAFRWTLDVPNKPRGRGALKQNRPTAFPAFSSQKSSFLRKLAGFKPGTKACSLGTAERKKKLQNGGVVQPIAALAAEIWHPAGCENCHLSGPDFEAGIRP